MSRPFIEETELPGRRITRDTLSVIAHRYYWVAQTAQEGRLVELCCGPALGLGYLKSKHFEVLGVDITKKSLEIARQHYQASVPLLQADAHQLPFPNQSIDTLVCLAAVIYLDTEKFISECVRVLKPGGQLLINSPNPAQPRFAPSALSNAYHTSDDWYRRLIAHGFTCHMWGAFAAATENQSQRHVLTAMRSRIRHFIPNSLKALSTSAVRFLRNLTVPSELSEVELLFVKSLPMVELTDGICDSKNRILYISARRAF